MFPHAARFAVCSVGLVAGFIASKSLDDRSKKERFTTAPMWSREDEPRVSASTDLKLAHFGAAFEGESQAILKAIEAAEGAEAFDAVGERFWTESPDAPRLLRRFAAQHRHRHGLAETSLLVLNLLEKRVGDDVAIETLARSALFGCVTTRPTASELRETFARLPDRFRQTLVEAYLLQSDIREPGKIFEFTRDLFQTLGEQDVEAKKTGRTDERVLEVTARVLARGNAAMGLRWLMENRAMPGAERAASILLDFTRPENGGERIGILADAAKTFPKIAAQSMIRAGANGAALRAVAQKLPARARSELLIAFAQEASKSDRRALFAFETLAPVDTAPAARAVIAQSLLRIDPLAANRWLEGMKPEDYAAVINRTFQNPDALSIDKNSLARFYLARVSDNMQPDGANLRIVIELLAQEKIETAAQTLAAFPRWDEKLKPALFSEFLRRCSADRSSQIDEIISAAPKELRSELTKGALQTLMEQDVEKALEWWRKEERGSENEKTLFATLAKPKVKIAPRELEALCKNALLSGVAPEDVAPAIHRMVNDLAAWDTKEALRAITALPAGSIQEGAVKKLCAQWALLDPILASEWIADMPPGRTRDIAAKELVSGAVDDPERALQVANAISDAAIRSDAIGTIVKAWRRIDSASLIGIIEASDIAADEKLRALATLRVNPPR